METRFREDLTLDFTEAKLKEDAGLAENLCVFYRESKNGRWYSENAIAELAKLMETHNNSFLNHAFFDRSIEDILGTFHDVRRGENGKIFANLKVMKSRRDFFNSMVELNPSDIGFSIDASGEIEEEGGPEGLDLVTSIKKLWSTDLVAFPATTKSLFESKVNEVVEDYLESIGISPEEAKQMIFEGTVPGNVSTDTASKGTSWSAPALKDFTSDSWEDLSASERKRIAKHFAWAKKMPPEKFGDLKLPHHRANDGKVVFNGIVAAAGRLNQTDIPSGDKSKVKSHLASHYHAFDAKAPWEDDEEQHKRSEKTMRDQLLRVLSSLGVNTDGLAEADEGKLQIAVDEVLTEDIQKKVATLEGRVETLEDEKESVEEERDELKDKYEELEEERDELRGKVDDYEAVEKERKARADAKEAFEAADLPERLISDTFVETYIKADEETQEKLIADRKEIAEFAAEGDEEFTGSREERENALDGEDKVEDADIMRKLKRTKAEERGAIAI